MARKKSWGAHARWCAIAIFQQTELNIKADPPCFARARADEAKIVRSRDAQCNTEELP